MEYLDVNAASWRLLMSVTLHAAVHLGTFYQESTQEIIETVSCFK